jgi:choline dehydrogenase-like flavoprotein
MLGGRTNHWGRISLRFGPQDFKRRSIDGLGDDWPIGYDDVAPFYDEVDRLIGVFGSVENLPNDPDSIFLPPPKPRLHEMMLQKSNKKLGITTIPRGLSILTKPINDERGVCFYCTSATAPAWPTPIFPRRPAFANRPAKPKTWTPSTSPWPAKCSPMPKRAFGHRRFLRGYPDFGRKNRARQKSSCWLQVPVSQRVCC